MEGWVGSVSLQGETQGVQKGETLHVPSCDGAQIITVRALVLNAIYAG
jgi:hypothetical protein